MHMNYVYTAITFLALEAALGVAWFVMLMIMNTNNNGYEQLMFLTGLHFLGAYLVYKIGHKMLYKRRISYTLYTWFAFFLFVAFVSARNLYQAWYALPNTLPRDNYWTMTVATTTTAFILSGLEFVWFVVLMSHQYNRERPALGDWFTIVLRVPKDATDLLNPFNTKSELKTTGLKKKTTIVSY